MKRIEIFLIVLAILGLVAAMPGCGKKDKTNFKTASGDSGNGTGGSGTGSGGSGTGGTGGTGSTGGTGGTEFAFAPGGVDAVNAEIVDFMLINGVQPYQFGFYQETDCKSYQSYTEAEAWFNDTTGEGSYRVGPIGPCTDRLCAIDANGAIAYLQINVTSDGSGGGTGTGTGSGAGPGDPTLADIWDRINNERTANGLDPLAWNPSLAQVAQQHANLHKSQGAAGYSRTLGGYTPAQRIDAAGISFTSADEAGAVGSSYSSTSYAFQKFMSSYQSKLMNASFTDVGIGVTSYSCATGSG